MGERVRIVAVLEVDKEKLAETGGNFEDEMRRAVQSGIRMVEYQEQRGEYEYASFLWNRSRGRLSRSTGRSRQSSYAGTGCRST